MELFSNVREGRRSRFLGAPPQLRHRFHGIVTRGRPAVKEKDRVHRVGLLLRLSSPAIRCRPCQYWVGRGQLHLKDADERPSAMKATDKAHQAGEAASTNKDWHWAEPKDLEVKPAFLDGHARCELCIEQNKRVKVREVELPPLSLAPGRLLGTEFSSLHGIGWSAIVTPGFRGASVDA
jgi:hypothetical protein